MKSFCLEGSTGIFQTQSIQTSLVLFKTEREIERQKQEHTEILAEKVGLEARETVKKRETSP